MAIQYVQQRTEKYNKYLPYSYTPGNRGFYMAKFIVFPK